MPKAENFEATFKRLKAVLKEYEKRMVLKSGGPENYYLNTPLTEKYQKELFFGAVQIKKNYVSYHLMPVYMFPELLKDVSPTLKKRMQGKSCFNFKTIDEDVLRELAALTKKSFERLRKEKLL
ncbi:MAG: hypothetical protein AAB354_01955 [candidate division KSB1 bacterium]